MNSELVKKFLINYRFILSKLGEMLSELLQPAPKVKPAYVPVKVKQFPVPRNNNDR